MTTERHRQTLFRFFNEMGIIQQLATTAFNRRLPEDLHVSHFGVINHLCRLGDGRTPRSIAGAFQVTKATMTNTLTKLSNRGYVEMRPNPEDGRSKLVYLTDSGRDFHNQAIATLYPMLDEMAEHLDSDAVAAIIPVLEEIRSYMDRARDAEL